MSIKTVKMQAHTRDCFSVQLEDKEGYEILDEQGYVPHWMPGKEYDNVNFEIDNETGQILNWKPIQIEDLELDEDDL